MRTILVIATSLFFGGCVEGLTFHLGSNAQRCLRDEVAKDKLVIGEFKISYEGQNEFEAPKVKLLVTDREQHVLAKVEDARKGKFSFVLEKWDWVDICFSSIAPSFRSKPVQVWLKVVKGVEARNYSELAKSTKFTPLEVEMMKLENFALYIQEDFVAMNKREVEMSNTNESTKSRVYYLSIFNFSWLFALAAGQILYLRSFFKSKKLIE